ncbi:MAG: tetratricopeptide repeat protein [Polyangiaceae bacterium]
MSERTSADQGAPPQGPRAVVVPFGVPEDKRGLGLGLAALVHHFARAEGENVALAQLLSRGAKSPGEEPATEAPKAVPVEAYLSPNAWRELEARGDAPPGVHIVLTGAFEPPEGASGALEIVAFEPASGRVLASGETTVRSGDAGKSVADTFDRVWREAGGELDLGARVGELAWDPLESVLYAERAALYDPLRAEPHDRLAALIHMGRAVEDSPDARFPAGRLAHLALETAATGDRRLAEAGHRALARASTDAPSSIELLEARAALELRFGASVEAEAAALAALTHAPKRSRLFALASEARRMRGDLSGARAVVADGVARAGTDPILLTERGMLAADQSDSPAARAAWGAALDYEPIFPPAFLNLAAMALRDEDSVLAQRLVDRVLSAQDGHPEVLRRAIVLALAAEPEGLARAARIAKIGDRLLAHTSQDAWTLLATAHAWLALGQPDEARRRFTHVEAVAADTSLAAEASRARFAIDEPAAAAAIDAVVREAMTCEPRDLPLVLARARALAATHATWLPRLALGLAARRAGEREAAFKAFEDTITLAPGCLEAHLELATLAVELDRPVDAVAHAERALELAGPAREVLLVLARALAFAGQVTEARRVVERLRAVAPNDAQLSEIEAVIDTVPEARPERPSLVARLARITERFRR